jgi:hypothetical protein
VCTCALTNTCGLMLLPPPPPTFPPPWTGDVCMYDISNPAEPRLASRLWLGGSIAAGGSVQVGATSNHSKGLHLVRMCCCVVCFLQSGVQQSDCTRLSCVWPASGSATPPPSVNHKQFDCSAAAWTLAVALCTTCVLHSHCESTMRH